MPSNAIRYVGRLIEWVAALLRASLVTALAVILWCIAYQVLMRYVFSKSPPWSEELALFMFSWATLGGMALGVYEGFHVRIDMLVNALSTTARAWAERMIEVITALFGAYLAWSGWRFVDVTSGSVSAAIGYPIEYLHSLPPVCGALMCLFATWRMISGPSVNATTELAP